METKLPYLLVAAFKHKSELFETEREALIAAINEVITPGPPRPVCNAIYDRASDLLPLLLRAVAVRSADAAVQLPGAAAHKEALQSIREAEEKYVRDREEHDTSPPPWPRKPTMGV
jgi:hypothetical protein